MYKKGAYMIGYISICVISALISIILALLKIIGFNIPITIVCLPIIIPTLLFTVLLVSVILEKE